MNCVKLVWYAGIVSFMISCSGYLKASALACTATTQRTLNFNLMRAVAAGRPLGVIKDLLEAKANVNARSRQRETPLRLACCKKLVDVDIINYLFAQGAKATKVRGYTLLSQTHGATVAEILLDHGQDPNGRSCGETELIRATKSMESYEKIKLLLTRGARINDIIDQADQNYVDSSDVDSDDERPAREKTALYCAVYELRTLLSDHFTIKVSHQEYTQEGALILQKTQSIVPIIHLLLCNGATVSDDTLDCMQEWIAMLQEDIDDNAGATQEESREYDAIKTILLALQKTLLDVFNNGDIQILLPILRKLDLTASAARHVAMSQEPKKYHAQAVATRYVLDPCAGENRSAVNIFSQLVRRQAGQSRTPMRACGLLKTTGTQHITWPTRTEIMQEEEVPRAAYDGAPEDENVVAIVASAEPTKARARSESKEAQE